MDNKKFRANIVPKSNTLPSLLVCTVCRSNAWFEPRAQATRSHETVWRVGSKPMLDGEPRSQLITCAIYRTTPAAWPRLGM